MLPSKGYAAQSATTPLAPFAFERRDPGPADVQIEILYCSVCHSDLHTARSEWPGTVYPCVPGHEILGTVTAVGDAVTKFKVGDTAAVATQYSYLPSWLSFLVDRSRAADEARGSNA